MENKLFYDSADVRGATNIGFFWGFLAGTAFGAVAMFIALVITATALGIN